MARLSTRLLMALAAAVAGAVTVLALYAWWAAPVVHPVSEVGPGLPAGERPAVDVPPVWVLRGTRLLVSGKWVLNPEDGRFTELPYAMARVWPAGTLDPLGASLSSSGESIVLWDEHEFRFGSVLGPLQGPWPLPTLRPADPEAAQPTEPLRQVLFWASEQQLVLYQIDRLSAEPQCSLFKTSSRQWSPLAHCPTGDFLEVVRIESGAGGWIVVTSGAEGMNGLGLALYDPDQDQESYQAPGYVTSWGHIRAHVSLAGDRIDLVTSCVLLSKSEADCEGRGEGEPWRLYSWRPWEDHLELVHERLPPDSVPAPVGRQVAWVAEEQVCIGEIASLERARCFCLPGSQCSARPAGG